MPRGTRATGYGAAGGRRDTEARSAKQKTRRERRMSDPRVRAAMEETEAARAELEKLMAQDQQGPAAGAFIAAARQKLEAAEVKQAHMESVSQVTPENPAVVVKVETPLPETGSGGKGWTKGQARSMLMQGYSLRTVIERTGFGKDAFDDIPLIDGLWGVSREEWIEAEEKRVAALERQNRSVSR